MRGLIESGDVQGLRERLARSPESANESIVWGPAGKNVAPALHYVCNAVFEDLIDQQQALEMASALLEAGVDPNLSFAKSGDSFLISAASLGAELVGLRLVDAGADIHTRGLFGATALHWAAMLGLVELTRRLVSEGAEIDLEDAKYSATPIGWAIHAWSTRSGGGHRERLPEVAAHLLQCGAKFAPTALEQLTAPEDEPMLNALRGD